MALLDGKQLRDQSTELGKLSGTGIVSFTAATMSFSAGSVLTTDTSNIVNGTDVVNKEYVDSVAAGLDPKESVAYTTTGEITLSGTGTQSGGDWDGALTEGDRILVKNQTDTTENGIYTVASGAWSRATDSDGTPASEVSLGNFTFVEYGTLSGSGYVLYSTDSATTPLITPGTDTQLWTLFSAAGSYTNGTGLNLAGGVFSIADTTVSANSYGQADSVTTFTVNAQGQLTAAGITTISITSSQVSDFVSASEAAVFTDANFVDGTTIDFTVTAGDSVTAEVIDASLQVSKLNTGSNGGATAGYVLSTDGTNFKWVLDEGDISAVTAGAGLTGGGSTGALTLEVNTDNGLSIVNDNVVLGGTLSQATTIDGNVLDFTLNNVDYLTLGSAVLDVNSNFVSIDSGTGPTQLLSGTDTTISASSSLNLVAEDGNVTTGNLEGLVYTADYSSTFVGNSLITKTYVDTGTASIWNAINSINNDFVTEITAGAGLTGGGTEGSINLDIVSANGGIVVNADDIALTLGAGNSGALTIEGDGLTLNTTTLAAELEGAGLTSNGGKLDIVSANGGIFVNTDGIELTLGAGNSGALTIENDGLTLNTTTLAAELEGAGLTSNGGKLSADLTINGGLTFSAAGDGGQIEVVVDNTTIQVVNGALTVVAGASQPVYQTATSSVATGNTGITLTSTPNDYSRIEVYVNGQLQNLTENTSGDCYFGVSGTAFASLVSGDSLYWNATNAGFTLSATDIIKIHYEA